MHDRWEYTIPADTAEADAVRVECRISPGVLKTLIVYNPPGCENLARCRVFLGEKPIAPRSKSNYIAMDGDMIVLRELNEPIRDDLPVLNWDVWNEDDTYEHTIWMSAEWSSAAEPYEKTMVRVLADFVDLMKHLLGIRR